MQLTTETVRAAVTAAMTEDQAVARRRSGPARSALTHSPTALDISLLVARDHGVN